MSSSGIPLATREPRNGGLNTGLSSATAERAGIDEGSTLVDEESYKAMQPAERPAPASGKTQLAGAPIVTPLSASNCCNSPAWNISRMMSQPPMNSPLT